jgi:hypothetical protein
MRRCGRDRVGQRQNIGHAESVIDQREMDRLAGRDAARLPPASMPAGLMFSLMAIPVMLSLLNAISPIIG